MFTALLCFSTDKIVGDPMEEWNLKALTAMKGDLKVKVKLEHGLIDKLEMAAGGFMSKSEAVSVESKLNNVAQMGELIRILEGKGNTAFWIFCQMLRDASYEVWADELEKKAREFRGYTGTHVFIYESSGSI